MSKTCGAGVEPARKSDDSISVRATRPGDGREERSLWVAEKFHGWRLRARRPWYSDWISQSQCGTGLSTCDEKRSLFSGRSEPASCPAQTVCLDRGVGNRPGDVCDKRGLALRITSPAGKVRGTASNRRSERMSLSLRRNRSSKPPVLAVACRVPYCILHGLCRNQHLLVSSWGIVPP